MSRNAKGKRVISVYEIERCFGGPEEGGWWYNHSELIESETLDKRVKLKRAILKTEKESKEWKKENWGNIYSMGGGNEYIVYLEKNAGDHQTKITPHYE